MMHHLSKRIMGRFPTKIRDSINRMANQEIIGGLDVRLRLGDNSNTQEHGEGKAGVHLPIQKPPKTPNVWQVTQLVNWWFLFGTWSKSFRLHKCTEIRFVGSPIFKDRSKLTRLIFGGLRKGNYGFNIPSTRGCCECSWSILGTQVTQQFLPLRIGYCWEINPIQRDLKIAATFHHLPVATGSSSQTWMKVKSHEYPKQYFKIMFFSVNGVVQDYDFSSKIVILMTYMGNIYDDKFFRFLPYGTI